MSVKCVLLLLCYHMLLGGAVSEFTPTVYSIESSAECGQYKPLHDQELKNELIETFARLPLIHRSCAAILNGNPSAPSAYYNITTTNGSSILVYCDMEGTNCGGKGGWMYINMTQPGATCPQGLEQQSFNGNECCGRFSPGEGCVSAAINTSFSYQQVCGRVARYEKDGPDGFRPFNVCNMTINQVYFEGLSIMYGTPHQHIWTYAAGFNENHVRNYDCLCNDGSQFKTPPYVGSDYYCESGYSGNGHDCGLFHNSDPLWD